MNGVKHNPSETGTTSSVLRKHPFTTLAQSRNQFINVVTLASVHNARLNHGVKRNTNTCMLIVRFVFHTRTNFSLHNADSSIVLYVTTCCESTAFSPQLISFSSPSKKFAIP